jgi:lysophospholipase L1-like esterase
VRVVVFYDESGNGALDGNERVRLADVVVEIAGRTARSEANGQAVVSGLPAGKASVSIRTDSLPTYYLPPTPVSVEVPQAAGAVAPLPVTLPIGVNKPNRYMAFGDSLTVGEGSSDGTGYRGSLQAALSARLGAAEVVNEGKSATRSSSGLVRLVATLGPRRPAYTIVLYGTNDWYDCGPVVPCYTVDSLRNMLEAAKSAQSLPVLVTIPPANPSFPEQVPPERNQWVHEIDALLRPLASSQGVVVADVEAVFLKQPSLPDLFADHVHPNDRGYAIMADEILRAITAARGSGTPSFSLLLAPGFVH